MADARQQQAEQLALWRDADQGQDAAQREGWQAAGAIATAQSATDQSLQGIRQALAEVGSREDRNGSQDSAQSGLASLLGQVMAHSLQPVVEHLEQSRNQQLGLHRVLMQVATRMQEQIDSQRAQLQRASTQSTLHAGEIDRAFDRMQEGRGPR